MSSVPPPPPVIPVYQLDTTNDHLRNPESREAINQFLRAHGIDPNRHTDGSLWLDTWQALDGHPLCEHCESCVKSERVVTPLVAKPPPIGWFGPDDQKWPEATDT